MSEQGMRLDEHQFEAKYNKEMNERKRKDRERKKQALEQERKQCSFSPNIISARHPQRATPSDFMMPDRRMSTLQSTTSIGASSGERSNWTVQKL